MSVQPELLSLTQQWVQAAEEDFLTAQYILTLKEDCPARTVSFHAQQTIEKYLKAFLTVNKILFPKTHDLLHLLSLFPRNVSLDISLRDVGTINRYAIEVRYPGDLGPVSREDAEKAFEVSAKIREQIRELLPKKVMSKAGKM